MFASIAATTPYQELQNDSYILKVGVPGAYRLSIFNDVHSVPSHSFLQQCGIVPGLKILDIGCGSGQMAIWLAKKTGQEGEVYAVDISTEQLAIAENNAKQQMVDNVSFIQSSIYGLTLPLEYFDLIYCRYFLIHLLKPETALANLLTFLKPKGRIVCEEPTMSTSFCYPYSKAYKESRKLLETIAKIKQLDFEIGVKLCSILANLNCDILNINLVQPLLKTPTERKLIELIFLECKNHYLSSGLLSKDEFDYLLSQLKSLTTDQTICVALPRTTQICGYKK